MGKLSLIFGVMLFSLGACASGEYGYITSTSSYTPDYVSNDPSAYSYSYVEPNYSPPPFWANGLQLEFGGGHRHHYRHEEGDWDRGD